MIRSKDHDCVYCDEALRDFADAVEHHSREHSSQRFNPLWYSEPGDWEESDVDDIDEVETMRMENSPGKTPLEALRALWRKLRP